MFRRIVYEDYQPYTHSVKYYYLGLSGLYFLLVFISPLIMIGYNIEHPGASVRHEYPRAFNTVTLLSEILFIIIILHIIVFGVLFCFKWKGRPVRHKTFLVTSFSFLIILSLSVLAQMTDRSTRGFLYFEMMLLLYLNVGNYNQIYAFSKLTITQNTGANNSQQRTPEEEDRRSIYEDVYNGDNQPLAQSQVGMDQPASGNQPQDDLGDIFMPDKPADKKSAFEIELSEKELQGKIQLKKRKDKPSDTPKQFADSEL